jgi:hypothetical protein
MQLDVLIKIAKIYNHSIELPLPKTKLLLELSKELSSPYTSLLSESSKEFSCP